MTKTAPTIEADVVEIDGVAVEPRPIPKKASSGAYSDWRDWKKWQRRAMKLDARWWPLWLLLGFIALVIIVAVGMCALVFYVFYRICKMALLGFASLFSPPPQQYQRR